MADITAFPIPTKVLAPADYPEFVGATGADGAAGADGPAGATGAKGDPGDVSSPDDSVATIVEITQADYDALDPKIADRLYLIVD